MNIGILQTVLTISIVAGTIGYIGWFYWSL